MRRLALIVSFEVYCASIPLSFSITVLGVTTSFSADCCPSAAESAGLSV